MFITQRWRQQTKRLYCFSILFLSQRVHVFSLLQNKFGLVFFRLLDGALETSNFRFEEARSTITLFRCFLHENTQRGKIARVKFAEELGTMSKNRLRWINLVRGPIWGIHSLTLMISWLGWESVKWQLICWSKEGIRGWCRKGLKEWPMGGAKPWIYLPVESCLLGWILLVCSPL